MLNIWQAPVGKVSLGEFSNSNNASRLSAYISVCESESTTRFSVEWWETYSLFLLVAENAQGSENQDKLQKEYGYNCASQRDLYECMPNMILKCDISNFLISLRSLSGHQSSSDLQVIYPHLFGYHESAFAYKSCIHITCRRKCDFWNAEKSVFYFHQTLATAINPKTTQYLS